jgi:hypothetical protein
MILVASKFLSDTQHLTKLASTMYTFDAETTFQYVIWLSSISNTKVDQFILF